MLHVTPVRVRLLWLPQPQFAGYLVAQYEGPAAQRDIALTCEPMQPGIGPVDAVLSGACELAVASPAHVIESRAPHELVMLLTIQQESSLVYPAARDGGVTSVAGLRGKRAGVWPGGEDLELRWMLQRAGLGGDAVTLVPVNDTVDALASGSVACAQMTTYHELFEFEHRVASVDPYVFFRAADYGAALLKDGLIARRDWVAANPALVQRSIDAILEGWTRAFDAPAAAVALCAALRPDLSLAHHERQLAAIRALSLTGATLTHGLGYPDPQHLDAALAAHHAVDGGTFDADRAALTDARFWSAVPSAYRRSRW